MPRSAAYLVLVVAVAYLVFGFLFTLLAPTWSAILDSQLFVFQTQWGKDYASWQQGIFDWLMLLSLIALLMFALIRSRRSTPG